MALLPLRIESLSDTSRICYTRASTPPVRCLDHRMSPSRGNASTPRDPPTPGSLRPNSPPAHRYESHPGHLPPHQTTEDHFAARMSQAKLAIPQHRREQLSSKPPQSCRDASDRNSLFAIGSWSIETHRRATIPQESIDFNLNEEAFGEQSLNWSSEPMVEDFVLFPEDIPEDDSQNDRTSSPPRAPRISRLRTPDIAPLSTDVQFFPCLGNEDEQDRVNEAWYLAGRDQLDAQSQLHFDDAIAYMAGVDEHARMLG